MIKTGQMLLTVVVFILFMPLLAAAGTVQLPQTGQTTCYDSAGNVIACAGTGQDGDIQAGVAWPSPRFTDNRDGTVTDNLTGLMWTKDVNLMTSRDPGFDTDFTPGDGAVPWQKALDYVAKLNTEAYLGYTDWRLPNINELESLVDAERWNPTLHTGYPFINKPNWFWSSTSYAYDSSYAWIVGFTDGGLTWTDKFWDLLVWPVRNGYGGVIKLPNTGQAISYAIGDDGVLRNGVVWPNVRFSDRDDETITDNLTGLMWTKNANLPGVFISWQSALDYVAGQ